MALFKFFKALFNRRKRKKVNPVRKLGWGLLSNGVNKKITYRANTKKAKKHKNKPKRKLVKNTRKKAKKRPSQIDRKKARKAKQARRKEKAPKRGKARIAIKEKEIGVITHYFDKISVGIIKLKGPLSISEHIHIKGKNTDFTQVISSMQYNHKDITLAKASLEIGIRVAQPVHENDVVYKAV